MFQREHVPITREALICVRVSVLSWCLQFRWISKISNRIERRFTTRFAFLGSKNNSSGWLLLRVRRLPASFFCWGECFLIRVVVVVVVVQLLYAYYYNDWVLKPCRRWFMKIIWSILYESSSKQQTAGLPPKIKGITTCTESCNFLRKFLSKKK